MLISRCNDTTEMTFSPSITSVAVGVALLGGYLLYRATIPKPIPGIPYDRVSARRPFGDIPDALKHLAKTSETLSFLITRCTELNSPIVQVFMRPFGDPWVVVADSREAQDIMVRRTQEFDRSEFFADLFISTIPMNQVVLKTNDQWQFNRRLMAPTMATKFLQDVAALRVYISFSALLDLWKKKASLADGHPMSVVQDVDDAMLDAMCAVAFGNPTGAVASQLQLVSTLDQLELDSVLDTPAEIPRAPEPEICTALVAIQRSVEIPMNSPLGRLHHRFAMRFYPSLTVAYKRMSDFATARLNAAWVKFNQAQANEDDVECATDLIVAREVALAKKEGRAPQHDSAVVRDELYGFLMAGYGTTAVTLQWGLKFLSMHQDAQKKLRQSLRNAAKSGPCEMPSAEEIAKMDVPYLDAVIEEILRCGCTNPSNVREAIVDTEILGYRIPKGTHIFMLSSGPDCLTAPIDVQDSKRSATSQQNLDYWHAGWETSSLADFQPERWLVDKQGSIQFDPRAGPQQIFGAGPRGCFGKCKASNMYCMAG